MTEGGGRALHYEHAAIRSAYYFLHTDSLSLCGTRFYPSKNDSQQLPVLASVPTRRRTEKIRGREREARKNEAKARMEYFPRRQIRFLASITVAGFAL